MSWKLDHTNLDNVSHKYTLFRINPTNSAVLTYKIKNLYLSTKTITTQVKAFFTELFFKWQSLSKLFEIRTHLTTCSLSEALNS